MENQNLLDQSGIIITIVLIAIPVIIAVILILAQAKKTINWFYFKKKEAEFQTYLEEVDEDEKKRLEELKRAEEFKLSGNELRGKDLPKDKKGIISNLKHKDDLQFVKQKKRSQPRPQISSSLSKLILWYLGCATFWLIFGTTVGEYLGIKFVAPDIDQVSWLSFGRLRPVHTNAVFWGWASLGMIGLGYYVIPRICNISIYSLKWGYRTLALINITVVLGSITLMAGINNSGGEYREYIWPVMLPFAVGIIYTLINFYKTVQKRKTHEIYVSSWYIISALIFLFIITFIAYWPSWQNGLGETIIQGYYMHQGVGMWFMLFCLGLMYYFLPQQLNKPIYSYSLGILAFWGQILFYTLIGTHHFIFSAIPWWLQTIAIVGSVGMVIPVIAGTTNFLLTFRGSYGKLSSSYTLPFYLIGIIFYFTGSLQGTAEAFRYTNLIWHFTDFTVAHSHITMYGIITFMLWAFIYTLVPRLTGKEPPQIAVGAHFWLALIGLLFYTIPLMIGSTEKGVMWLEGVPFVEGIKHMTSHWVWRAVGGSLMWLSHLIFAYNFYVMVRPKEERKIPEKASEILIAKEALQNSKK